MKTKNPDILFEETDNKISAAPSRAYDLNKLNNWRGMSEQEREEYIESLESGFDEWDKTKKENIRQKEYIKYLEDVIKNGKKNLRIPMAVFRKYFTCTIRPDVVKEKLGLYSAALVVKKTEEHGLFKYPELVVRVARTKKIKGKYETTVLYSLMGIAVLKSFIKKDIEKLIEQAPTIGHDEQREIEAMFTRKEMNEMKKHRGKSLKYAISYFINL